MEKCGHRAFEQNLAEQYVRMRKDMKLTQEQVSRRSGIPRSNIARFESGRYNPSLELMVKMAASMGLKVQIQLVPDKDKIKMRETSKCRPRHSDSRGELFCQRQMDDGEERVGEASLRN